MKRLIWFVAIALCVLFISSCDSDSDLDCWEFRHQIRDRAIGSEWSVWTDTLCHITEEHAEAYRVEWNTNTKYTIRMCKKQRVTSFHVHNN